MRHDADNLPTRQPMRAAHKVRKARRSNDEHGGRAYLGRRSKPWKHHLERNAA